MRTSATAPPVLLLLLAACGGTSVSNDAPSDATPNVDAFAASVAASSDAGATTTAPTVPADACTRAEGTPYSVYKTAFFGVLHQHTSYSIDAYGFGTRVTPTEAYAFAKGGTTITTQGGRGPNAGPLAPPLDFLAVTDHSEWLGLDHVVQGCVGGTSAECQALRGQTKQAWQDEQNAAASAYERCKFTSLVAYEWTSAPDDGQGGTYTNHRNVIFQSATVPEVPLDSNDYPTAQKLFSGLDAQCSGACGALVIPHNTNLSQGQSLALPSVLSPDELAAMQKYQRLVEIYQHKGSSECLAGGNDPACSFEYVPVASGETDSPNSYVRESLGNGIVYATTHGSANPLELGVIAAVDDHNGTAGWVEEDRFIGHLGVTDGSPNLRLQNFPAFSPGGLAGVWAEQNTREAIYAALQRRETYGTSGPRMQVRFYATKSASPCTGDFPKTIVDQGAIPMGGTLTTAGLTGAPTFAIAAWPDPAAQPTIDDVPGGRPAQLESAAVIKVHAVTRHGVTTMVEDRPQPIAIAPQGSCATWTDPGFDATEKALYYVRVLQEKTHRWSYYDCQANPRADGCEATGELRRPIQERAWTSPIWFTP